MQDILQDIVSHTHKLGFITTLKITAETDTQIESMADDRSVIMSATTHSPVGEFVGTFGMPDLGKLDYHLKNPDEVYNQTLHVSKFWPILSEEDRDFIQGVQDSIEHGWEWVD